MWIAVDVASVTLTSRCLVLVGAELSARGQKSVKAWSLCSRPCLQGPLCKAVLRKAVGGSQWRREWVSTCLACCRGMCLCSPRSLLARIFSRLLGRHRVARYLQYVSVFRTRFLVPASVKGPLLFLLENSSACMPYIIALLWPRLLLNMIETDGNGC